MRKAWEQPKLVILVRRMAGEAILSGCKTQSNSSGANHLNLACFAPEGTTCGAREGSLGTTNGSITCVPCSDIFGS